MFKFYSTMSNCIGNGYVEWIDLYFGDCVYNLTDFFSFLLGMCSFVLFLFAFYPQIVSILHVVNGRGTKV